MKDSIKKKGGLNFVFTLHVEYMTLSGRVSRYTYHLAFVPPVLWNSRTY